MEGVVDGVRSTPQRQRRLAKVIVLRNMEDELQGKRECLKATHSPPTLLDAPQSRKAPPTHCRVLVGVAFALRFQLRKPHKHPRHRSKILRRRRISELIFMMQSNLRGGCAIALRDAARRRPIRSLELFIPARRLYER